MQQLVLLLGLLFSPYSHISKILQLTHRFGMLFAQRLALRGQAFFILLDGAVVFALARIGNPDFIEALALSGCSSPESCALWSG